jgi:hypothetical protein
MAGAGALRAPEGDGGDGGGTGTGTGGPPKTFTQEELSAIVSRETKKVAGKYADYDAIKSKAAQVDELTGRMAALEEEKANAGKSAEEKERARASKEAATLQASLAAIQKERDEAKAALDSERGNHRMTRARQRMVSALTGSEVHGPALADALDTLVRESEMEFGDDGELQSVTLNHDGTRYPANDLKKAAEAFLKSKPWFAKGATGGGGHGRPGTGYGGNGTGQGGRALHEMSVQELQQLDAQRAGNRP